MPMIGNYMPGDPNKKLYNAGSEWQDEFGGVIDYYSTFFREYDPVIGRFNSVDPKAEMTVELSIYHYSGNNPVNFNDPMGDWFTDGVAGFGANRNLGGHGYAWSGENGYLFGGSNGDGNNPVLRLLATLWELSKEWEIQTVSLHHDENGFWSADIIGSKSKNNGDPVAVWRPASLSPSYGNYVEGWESKKNGEVILLSYYINLGKFSPKISGITIWALVLGAAKWAEKLDVALSVGRFVNYTEFSFMGAKYGWWQNERGGFSAITNKGGRYIGGRNAAKEFSNSFRNVSDRLRLGQLTVALSVFEFGNDLYHKRWGDAVVHGTDAVAAGIGLIVPGAQIFVGAYFLGRLIGEIF